MFKGFPMAKHAMRTVLAGIVACLLCPPLDLTAAEQPKTLLGIDVLQEQGFKALEGKRVGLLTHQAGVNGQGISSIDVLYESPLIDLRALYAPEHGIDSVISADVRYGHSFHPKTRLPVYSLYGEYRKPSPRMLAPIDVMVVDLQDVGVRSYTYVACMKLTMEACFENGKPVIVLDRPNPLGGIKVDGPVLEDNWKSYVGPFPTPYVHGLTIGEIARKAKGTPGWLDLEDRVRQRGRLYVIAMRGWSRDMLWPATGLKWVATSPNIPDLSAVMGYSMTGLGAQIGGFRHGIGTPYPFRLLTFPGVPANRLQQRLAELNIPGLQFKEVPFIQSDGRRATGVYTSVTDFSIFRPTELSFYMMKLSAEFQGFNPFQRVPYSQQSLFNKHVGSTEWWKAVQGQGAQVDVERFIDKWQGEARKFRAASRPFWIYR